MNFDDVNFEKRKYSRLEAYDQSKLACFLFALELNHRLGKKGLFYDFFGCASRLFED